MALASALLWCSTARAVVLESSTFLGGAGYDRAKLVALGRDGSLYVAGETESGDDFPSARVIDGGHGSLFVAKISGGALSFVSRFGAGSSVPTALAIAPDGSIVVGGFTYAKDFPLVRPLSSALGEDEAASFVTKVTADGSQIVFSTFIPGTQMIPAGSIVWPRTEVPAPQPRVAIAVDDDGRIFVAGTAEADFPTTVADVPAFAGKTDGFVARLASDGSTIEAATRVGGDEYDAALGIALSADGHAYVGGVTNSTSLPVRTAVQSVTPDLPPGLQTSGFYARFSRDLDEMDVLSYLGGSQDDQIDYVAVSEQGVFLAGNTVSFSFPTTPGAWRSRRPVTMGAAPFGFVTHVDPDTPQVVYSTFIAPPSDLVLPSWESTHISGFGLDASGAAHVVGSTLTDTFELVESIDDTTTGYWDIFYARLTPDGSNLIGSTYLGGNSIDHSGQVAATADGDAVLVGMTLSPRFPAKNALQARLAGLSDAFIARLAPGTPVPTTLPFVSTTTSSTLSYDDTPETCGDPDGDGSITASDALHVLRSAVGLEPCDGSICDVDGSGSTSALDALKVLAIATGTEVHPFCGA